MVLFLLWIEYITLTDFQMLTQLAFLRGWGGDVPPLVSLFSQVSPKSYEVVR